MKELFNNEVDLVSGGDWNDVAFQAESLALLAGAAAAIPSPASPALAFTALAISLGVGAATWYTNRVETGPVHHN